ncbi:hypothetical protein MMC25_008343 [Agyrium rufum]|nr:hypothetical protein [Agyrium rufum]
MSTPAQDEFNALLANNRDDRFTTHADDAGHASDASDLSSDKAISNHVDEDSTMVPMDHLKPTIIPSAVYHIPIGTHFDANTGPKGVIADAKSFDQARKRGFRQTLYAFSNGVTGNVFDKPRTQRSLSREKSSSPELSEEEDHFLQTWRQRRMTEMQNGTPHQDHHRTRRQSPSQRRFGYLSIVDANGYLDAVERVASHTTVVVCIYDPRSSVSGIVEDAIMNLARKHEFIRFVKLPYDEAEMDAAAVPAIIAYRGGEIIANLVSVIDEIPSGRHVSASSIESLLQQHRVLQ